MMIVLRALVMMILVAPTVAFIWKGFKEDKELEDMDD